MSGKKGEDIIIVGLQTGYCIDAAVKCGFEHGFKMIVHANTNSTFDNDFMSAEMIYKYYNDFMWNKRYAECISFEKTLELINKQILVDRRGKMAFKLDMLYPWGRNLDEYKFQKDANKLVIVL